MLSEASKTYIINSSYKQAKKNIKCIYCNQETEHKDNEYNKDSLIYICKKCNKQFHYNENKNQLFEEQKN